MGALLDELIPADRIHALPMSVKEQRNRSVGAEQEPVADLRREAADAETALAGLCALVERGLVDPNEPTLGERLQKLIQRRDLCRQARDRALAALSTPLDVDAATIHALALDRRQRLTTGEISARKAWPSPVVDRILVSDEKIPIVDRKSNFEGPLSADAPVRPPIPSSNRNGALAVLTSRP
jgi:hypothetical protein